MTPNLRDLVRWDDTFSVDDPILDEQHRDLFRLLERLVDGVEQGDDARAAARGVTELREDCSAHFSTEEQYLERHEYPELVKQHVQHQLFLRRLTNLVNRLETGQESLNGEAVDSLASWLRGHIYGLDREYADYFRDRGA